MKYILIITFIYIIVASSTLTNHVENVKLTEDNFVAIRGPINTMSSAKVIDDMMKKKHNNVKDLYVYISSNGGSVAAGMQIVQTIQALQTEGVNVICIGNIALSMGFVILQYCDIRYGVSSSLLMQHQMSLGTEGPLKNVNNYMTLINDIEIELDEYQSKRLGLTIEEFRKKVDHDWWLTGTKALENKALDKIVHVFCDFKPGKIMETLHTIFGEVNVTYSTCPITVGPLKVEYAKQNYSSDKIGIFEEEYMLSDKYVPMKKHNF